VAAVLFAVSASSTRCADRYARCSRVTTLPSSLSSRLQCSSTPAVSRCPIIRSPPSRIKVSSGRKFTGKKSARSAAARAKHIFTRKLSAGGDFSGGILFWGDFMGRRYFSEEKTYQIVIIFSRADFSWGIHFNVTPAAETERQTASHGEDGTDREPRRGAMRAASISRSNRFFRSLILFAIPTAPHCAPSL